MPRRMLGSAAGGALGATLGFAVAVAILVGKARLGSYLFSLEGLLGLFRWELIPVPLGLLAGAAVGWSSARLVGVAGLASAMGLAAGVGFGWLLGAWAGTTETAPWAGALLGAGLGSLAGGVAAPLYARFRAPRPETSRPVEP